MKTESDRLSVFVVSQSERSTKRRLSPCTGRAFIGYRRAKIAICSSGGIVPKGNPDHIRVSSAMNWGKYDISKLDDLTPENYESIHGGYDRTWALEDPDRVLPLDEMRKLEREGAFGKHGTWISFVWFLQKRIQKTDRE